MKRYSIHSLLTACLMTLVTGLALVSCSQDEAPEAPALVPEGSPVTVSLTLSTRAEETAGKDPYYDYPDGELAPELINNWWVVALTANGNEPGDFVAQKYGTLSKAAHETSVSLDLPVPSDGQYYFIFAFANISESDIASIDWEGDFDEVTAEAAAASSSKMPSQSSDEKTGSVDWEKHSSFVWKDISTRLEALNNEISYSADKKTAFVPMSGINKVKVTRHVNQKYSIEVVRMLAKIRFEFANSSEHSDILVKSVEVSPYSDKSSLRLFPQYANKTTTWDFLQNQVSMTPEAKAWVLDDTRTDDTRVWQIGKTLKAGSSADYVEANSFTRYIREMEADNSTTLEHLFRLNFTIQRGNSASEDTVFTYMADDFNFVNRNDYVILPVRFTDWEIDFKLRSYPPIGGYPAHIENQNDAELVASFSTPGRFEIIPTVSHHVAGGGKETFEADKIDFTVEIVRHNILEDGSLKKTSSGEITGDIATNPKSGYDYILFRLTKAGTHTWNAGDTWMPTKRIYIVRK